MMAMKAFNRTLALQTWREATTIYTTAGHGGCGPSDLALAAHRRPCPTEIYVNGDGVLFRQSVRGEEKREVILPVHDDFVRQVHASGIAVHHRVAGTAELTRCSANGGIALVLISTWRLMRERAPHWVSSPAATSATSSSRIRTTPAPVRPNSASTWPSSKKTSSAWRATAATPP